MRRQRRHAELDSEGKYLKAQKDLQKQYSVQGARMRLQEQEACVKQQIAEAEAERKEVRSLQQPCCGIALLSIAAADATCARRRTRTIARSCPPSLARQACPSRWASPPKTCSKATCR